MTVSDADTEYKALFALHTTYAIIVKLIACKVLESNIGASSTALADLSSEKMREFFQRMEDGLEYRNIGIRNFLEGDFFSWYADEQQWSDIIWTEVKDIIRKIDDYSTFSIEVKYAPVDVFKDLYKETDTANPVTLNELYLTDKELAVYFTNHKHLLDKQSEKSKSMHRGGEFYALSKIGPYTFAPHLVAARDNSSFCASVINPTHTPWGEWKHSVCVKHTIIISQGVDGHFITEDEAHYINGVLNSSIVKAYIHSTFKTNGFSLKKSHLYLPLFNPTNETQAKIVSLSKEATSHAERRNRITEELTQMYLDLCKNR